MEGGKGRKLRNLKRKVKNAKEVKIVSHTMFTISGFALSNQSGFQGLFF